ncbi:uncharacterized protein LODBEIA_P49320 [Lodderomyces beijingensis]|uniref:Signal peptidase complex subunit 2 n=1 Tax=Lodderomyces beijingensis TaxID=1775926 RepID=A0ABP0ZRC8_9ASCO
MSQLKKSNLNSVKDLQKTTDEHLGSVLTQLGYEESFKLIDLKLGLGLVSVLIAGLLFVADKKFQFKDIYSITVVCCVVYSVLNAAILAINYRYKNVKYVGYDSKGNKLTLATETKKYEPVYYLSVDLNGRKHSTSIPFNKFFDAVGYFIRDEFTKELSEEISKKNQ